MPESDNREAAKVLESGIGRRDLLRAAVVIGGAATVAGIPVATATAATAAPAASSGGDTGGGDRVEILQPGSGRITATTI